jgi:hypothetical protein
MDNMTRGSYHIASGGRHAFLEVFLFLIHSYRMRMKQLISFLDGLMHQGELL